MAAPVGFVPATIGAPNCTPPAIYDAGIPTVGFRFALYPWTGDMLYPPEACPYYRHDFMEVTDLKWAGGVLSTRAPIWDAKKSFDISHPTKDGWRLRHVCLEGPDADVYIKGKLKDSNVIDLPPYWSKLIDPDTVNVVLTPIGIYQELFVEKIEWGSRVIIKNSSGGPIHCYYQIIAERIDVAKNIPEYQGLTQMDYPGDNSEYSINGR